MTVRTARSKRTRLANRRRLNAARPHEARLIPLMVVKPDGTYVQVPRPVEPARS
jgi:hypothetical protein